MTLPGSPGLHPSFANVAACVLLAAFLLACNGDDAGSTTGERLLLLEAEAHSLEESLEALQGENIALRSELAALRYENAALTSELAALRQSQEEFIRQQEAAQAAQAAQEHEDEVADFEEGQEQQLAALEEGQFRTEQRLDDLDEWLHELESATSEVESLLRLMEKWPKDAIQEKELPEKTGEGSSIDNTLRLVAENGGQAQVINYGAAYGGARSAVLVLPDKLPDGEIPLIVSLHEFGGDSFSQSLYVPLHQRVNRDEFAEFALLLPNGIENAEGQRSWNPTDGSGKADQDDVGALTALVQEASGEFDAGPVYIFGYSNGGFMAYYMACKGLPGLRAVASLAGTSYVDDSACYGAPPVSVLHIHGKQDGVIRYHGSDQPDAPHLVSGEGYAGAEDMFQRWGERAGCNVQSVAYGLGVDLDDNVEGPETLAYAFPEGCAEGITVELWSSNEGGHTPGYGDVFVDALLDWLLSQE